MPHLLIAGKLHPAGLALVEAAPELTFDYVEAVSETDYAPLIGKADALVIRTQPLSAQTVAEASRLKLVSRHGVGFDSVDVAALNARRIPLCIVGDTNSLSVAEHAMMLILACAKQALRADRAVRSGGWDWRNRLEASEVSGKRLLIAGFGRAGRRLAGMARAFAMDVSAYDPFLAERGWPDAEVAPVASLQEGLAAADFVSVHVPKAGRPLIGAQEFAQLKPGAVIVNTARGGVVDEAALAAALRSGRIAAAGLDVFDDEPPAKDNPLLGFDNVLLSPHIAGVTVEAAERMAVSSVQNVLDFFAGRLDPDLIVNRTF
jgi:D-3-phosphoglycerate dehydrogenase